MFDTGRDWKIKEVSQKDESQSDQYVLERYFSPDAQIDLGADDENNAANPQALFSAASIFLPHNRNTKLSRMRATSFYKTLATQLFPVSWCHSALIICLTISQEENGP